MTSSCPYLFASADSLNISIADQPGCAHSLCERSSYTAVVVAEGYVDASNAGEFIHCIRSAIGEHHSLVIDLSGVDFFAIAGISVLQSVHKVFGPMIRIAVVPSPSVARLLQICSSAPVPAIVSDFQAALAAVQVPADECSLDSRAVSTQHQARIAQLDAGQAERPSSANVRAAHMSAGV